MNETIKSKTEEKPPMSFEVAQEIVKTANEGGTLDIGKYEEAQRILKEFKENEKSKPLSLEESNDVVKTDEGMIGMKNKIDDWSTQTGFFQLDPNGGIKSISLHEANEGKIKVVDMMKENLESKSPEEQAKIASEKLGSEIPSDISDQEPEKLDKIIITKSSKSDEEPKKPGLLSRWGTGIKNFFSTPPTCYCCRASSPAWQLGCSC